MQTRKRTVTSSFSLQRKCCQIAPAIDPERKITSRDLFSAPALRWLSFFWKLGVRVSRRQDREIGNTGSQSGKGRTGTHAWICTLSWPINFCDWLFRLSCLILITTFTSSWLLYQSPFVYCDCTYALHGSLNDNAFYYWLQILFNLQEWNTIKSRTVTFRLVSYATRHA